MALESLQQNTLGTVRDVTTRGSSIKSSFGNLALNLSAAFANVGLQAFAKKTGISAVYASPEAVTRASANLTASPGQVQKNFSQQNVGAFALVVLGVAAVATVFVVLARRRKVA